MVVSNDVFDDQLQTCSRSIDPAGESVLPIGIKTRFMGERGGTVYPVKPMGCGKRREEQPHMTATRPKPIISHNARSRLLNFVISLRRTDQRWLPSGKHLQNLYHLSLLVVNFDPLVL